MSERCLPLRGHRAFIPHSIPFDSSGKEKLRRMFLKGDHRACVSRVPETGDSAETVASGLKCLYSFMSERCLSLRGHRAVIPHSIPFDSSGKEKLQGMFLKGIIVRASAESPKRETPLRRRHQD